MYPIIFEQLLEETSESVCGLALNQTLLLFDACGQWTSIHLLYCGLKDQKFQTVSGFILWCENGQTRVLNMLLQVCNSDARFCSTAEGPGVLFCEKVSFLWGRFSNSFQTVVFFCIKVQPSYCVAHRLLSQFSLLLQRQVSVFL